MINPLAWFFSKNAKSYATEKTCSTSSNWFMTKSCSLVCIWLTVIFLNCRTSTSAAWSTVSDWYIILENLFGNKAFSTSDNFFEVWNIMVLWIKIGFFVIYPFFEANAFHCEHFSLDRIILKIFFKGRFFSVVKLRWPSSTVSVPIWNNFLRYELWSILIAKTHLCWNFRFRQKFFVSKSRNV